MAEIRKAREEDFIKIHNFVSSCGVLEKYPAHVYKIILRYFSDTCLIAEDGDKIAGFVSGFFSQREKHKYFLWQIGVDPALRGRGVGSSILKELEKRLGNKACRLIELSVDPENISSRKLFEKMKYKNVSSKTGPLEMVKGIKSVKDFYGPGRHFIIMQKKIK